MFVCFFIVCVFFFFGLARSFLLEKTLTQNAQFILNGLRYVWVISWGSMRIAYDSVLENQIGSTLMQCMTATLELEHALPCVQSYLSPMSFVFLTIHLVSFA